MSILKISYCMKIKFNNCTSDLKLMILYFIFLGLPLKLEIFGSTRVKRSRKVYNGPSENKGSSTFKNSAGYHFHSHWAPHQLFGQTLETWEPVAENVPLTLLIALLHLPGLIIWLSTCYCHFEPEYRLS